MAKHFSAYLYSQELSEEGSSDKGENEYNPNLYAGKFEDEDEEWGDLDSQVDYKSPLPVKIKEKPPPAKPQPVLTAPKPSLINQKYFGINNAPKPEPKIKQPTAEETLAEIAKGKIEELNQSLYKAKKEAEKNARFRNNLMEKVKSFNKAKEELEAFESGILKEIQDFNENELEKIKREAKVHERNQKVLSGIPNKKDRDELEAMKGMLAKIKEEGTIKHNRFKLNKDRVTKLLEDAKNRKKELIKRLETLESLAGKDVPSQKLENQTARPPARAQSDKFQPVPQVDYTFNPEEFEKITQQMSLISNSSENKTNEAVTTSPKKAAELVKSKSYSKIESAQKTENTETNKRTENTEISKKNEKTEKLEPETYRQPEYAEKIPMLDHKTFQDGRVLKLYESGHRETQFPNGTRKEEYPNGYNVFFYANKDIKQVFPDGKTVYFYAEFNTSHTSLPDGTKIIRFGNGQVEKHLKDGTKKIKYIDGTVRRILANGDQETVYPDGTLQIVLANGNSSIFHPGGHKELHAGGINKRVYFNGTSKTISI